ncbi:leucine-rich repeat protein kinase family protein [Striga asiatica]|uniref:Leucine-rich repeat protein kinase family protein n=1 Tax=Striga asiatica TaxID=4170 RepID=A0A5A7PI07_STRAF|nr:leucine-rich repeat protein kinase family protein [Striga asiatica]
MRSLLLGLLFLIRFSPLFADTFNPSLSDDVLGLIVFKSDIKDPADKLRSWVEDDASACYWTGVTCNNKSSRVSQLNLTDFGLSGKLGRGLLKLKFLSKLLLSRNNFTGSLSLNFSQLSNLTVLDLSENGFSGSIPDELFKQCGTLRSVSLARNKLSGPIPVSLAYCSSLVSVDFSGNQFSGSLPLGIWSLSGLRSLDLSDNMLEGEIPEDIHSLKYLRTLSLRNNRLSGKVPDGIGNCLLLRLIDLSFNSFSGGIPNKLQKLSFCRVLGLGGNGFTGNVPKWIGEMRSLETLDLSENNFSGQIPDSFGKLRSLKFLNVSKNALSGSLPDSLSKCENLLTVDVSRNSLTGNFPSWVFKIGLQQVVFSDNGLNGSFANALASSSEIARKQLLYLDVSQNKLSSEIPPVVGDFKSLQLLNMSRNSFRGGIPEAIWQLKSLKFLDLSENQLTGVIPREIGLNLSLISLSFAHNLITGPIPPSFANLANLQTVNLSFNNLTGSLPKPLANLVSLHSFDISHNNLHGDLPSSPFFNTIDPSSISANPSLCGSAANTTCPKVLPKPIVLNPNSTNPSNPTTHIPPTFPTRGKKILSISALIAIGAAASIVVGVIAVTVLNLRVQAAAAASLPRAAALDFSPSSRSPSSASCEEESGKLVMFSKVPGLAAAAAGHALLSKDRELGRGGFGAVYRSALADGRPVAVKRLAVSGLVKSEESFEHEVRNLGRARHINLVALEGYYWTPSLQLLIYEFVSGGSLYKCLHESVGRRVVLSWDERFGAILGTARGLAHLHRMGIIHYNIKSSNVLIDESSGEVKVADYGLAKLLPMLDRYVLSSKIQSALGYMAPEFACKTVKITDKCDVYGFGILVLEMVTGRRPVEYMEDDVVVLSDMVRGAAEEGRVEECVDPRLGGKFPLEEAIPVIKLGLVCTSQVPSSRPEMAEAVKILELIRCPSESNDSLG